MASVTSLDQDMRKLRLDRYTPAAANEIRKWIESTLAEPLPPGDLMEALRDGVALCKLVNLAVSPGVKYKASNMPFVQMENISHFLKACELPPLSLPSHDRFLTVDLYDGKDPAQVLQCITAFSRKANAVNPGAFPTVIGVKSKGGAMSPDTTGSGAGVGSSPYTPKITSYTSNTSPARDTSPATTFNSLNRGTYAGSIGPSKVGSLSKGGLATGGPVSSWSSKADENKTAPAWNIHQYGYMGGASQGNQGVAFGARRQIVSAAPRVPSLAEKEKNLREKLEREKKELEEDEERRRAQTEADEAMAQEEEERKWQEETTRLRQEEQAAIQQQQIVNEQARRNQEAEDRIASSRNRQRTTSDARLNGQFLSQYQASQKSQPPMPVAAPTATAEPIQPQPSAEARRIADLERQLAEMKAAAAERERLEQSQTEVQSISSTNSTPQKPALPSRTTASNVATSHEDDWATSEREHLQKAWQDYQREDQNIPHAPSAPHRSALAEPATSSSRPLPDPATYQPNTSRTSRFLSSNPAPEAAKPASHTPSEAAHSTTAEVDTENARREASQRATRAGGWASKSLLEREMERERERQREWEESQRATASVARDSKEGSGPGQTWDVHQYGYMGGDSQNRGGPGLGVGGARRQILGPRPPP
ncbi:calponin [Neophaeococcomyces mojaviensis]|uniref:Calponin n=1 Tax=Neophaeococcomyces mojaviensis TaxID=3383035 RepID=A0ACC3AA99_9EURO|nr:calponin [Knufia sp. JES_112]